VNDPNINTLDATKKINARKPNRIHRGYSRNLQLKFLVQNTQQTDKKEITPKKIMIEKAI
jgi:hypothetical protein